MTKVNAKKPKTPHAMQVAMPKSCVGGYGVGMINTEKLDTELSLSIIGGLQCMNTETTSEAQSQADDAKRIIATVNVSVMDSYRELCRSTELVLKEAQSVSRNVRQASESLGQGLARIEKTANLDKLERHANTLERIVDSLKYLSEMESAGKLDKIAAVLK